MTRESGAGRPLLEVAGTLGNEVPPPGGDDKNAVTMVTAFFLFIAQVTTGLRSRALPDRAGLWLSAGGALTWSRNVADNGFRWTIPSTCPNERSAEASAHPLRRAVAVQHGVEGPQALGAAEQVEALEEILLLGLDKGRKPHRVLRCPSCSISTRSAPSPDMGELLDDLDRRRRPYLAVGERTRSARGRDTERVVGADRVHQDRRVEDDHARRPRISSNSSRSPSGPGTSIESAANTACNADRRSPSSPGKRSSIASRTNTATGTPRRPASRSSRDQRLSSIRTCKRRSSMLRLAGARGDVLPRSARASS